VPSKETTESPQHGAPSNVETSCLLEIGDVSRKLRLPLSMVYPRHKYFISNQLYGAVMLAKPIVLQPLKKLIAF
jgi:hypothetical protein